MNISEEIDKAMIAIEQGNLKSAAEIVEGIARQMRADGVNPETHPDIQFLASLMATGLMASRLEKEDPSKLDQLLGELHAGRNPHP